VTNNKKPAAKKSPAINKNATPKKDTTSKVSLSNWQVPTFKIEEFRIKGTKYCVCIPLINEGEKIKKQLKEMNKVSKIADIVICDGGSTDGSTDPSYLKKMNVRTLLTKTGSGKLSAQLRMGYSYALKQGYDGIITIDGNGKDKVDEIEEIIHKLDEGYDYIQASRFIQGGEAINTPPMRYFAIRLVHAPVLSIGARHWFTDTTSGFRGYSSQYLLDSRVQPFRDIFNRYELLAYLTVRASQLGYKVTEVPATRAYPAKGKTPTKITFRGNLDLLKVLSDTLRGKYHPSS
jgi:dolichol-phosphate mannosyltransferase